MHANLPTLDHVLALVPLLIRFLPYDEFLVWTPDAEPELSEEATRAVCALRTVCRSIDASCSAFLQIVEFRSFVDFCLECRRRTDRARMGVEDMLSHFNPACYQRVERFRLLRRYRARGLSSADLVANIYRWMRWLPSSIRPDWYAQILSEPPGQYRHLAHPVNVFPDYYMRRHPNRSFELMVPFGSPQLPDEPLSTCMWNSYRGLMIPYMYFRFDADA